MPDGIIYDLDFHKVPGQVHVLQKPGSQKSRTDDPRVLSLLLVAYTTKRHVSTQVDANDLIQSVMLGPPTQPPPPPPPNEHIVLYAMLSMSFARWSMGGLLGPIQHGLVTLPLLFVVVQVGRLLTVVLSRYQRSIAVRDPGITQTAH